MKNSVIFKFSINLILFFSVLYCLYLYSSYKDDKLKKCFKICNASITGSDYGYRLGCVLSYEYIVDKKKYLHKTKRPISMRLGQSLVNKKLVVIYSCNDPNEHWLMLNKSDFDTYKIVYPDSLFWLKKELELDRGW